MVKIAHRGNTNGPNPEMENNPKYLLEALSLGFDVEVDVWLMGNEICFGHDFPEYMSIPESFLIEIGHRAWFHCKNLEALYFFNSTFPQLNYFWHQSDDHTLTSQGYIWTYPGKAVVGKSVIVDLELSRIDQVAYAICSDWGKSLEA
jgi:hypothetical protein